MPCNPNTQICRAAGPVRRIFPSDNAADVRLEGLSSANKPGGGEYFRLPREHPNYNALYSLILVAFTNRQILNIRTEDPINSSEYAVISYVFVDWK